MHLLKGALGTGILAMPEAFMNSGIVIGIIGTIIITILCAYCIHILVRSSSTKYFNFLIKISDILRFAPTISYVSESYCLK